MPAMTYKVVPAPARGKRAKGAKGIDGRFANAMQEVLNEMAAEGWTYLRAETLPSQDRVGVTRRVVETYQNVLVFCKKEISEEDAVETPQVEANAQMTPVVAPLPAEPSLSTPAEPEVEETAEDAFDEFEEFLEKGEEGEENKA